MTVGALSHWSNIPQSSETKNESKGNRSIYEPSPNLSHAKISVGSFTLSIKSCNQTKVVSSVSKKSECVPAVKMDL